MRAAEILLVEDNDDEVELMRQACRICKLDVSVQRVANGVECMEYLRQQGRYAGAALPDLIVLDVNMPLMNGHQVMAAIASDERLRHLPVVVLTSSAARADISSMLKLRCSSYVVKPMDFDEFVGLVRNASRFWLNAAVLPQPAGGMKR